MKVICRCGAVYKLTPKFKGKKVNCKMCGRRLETGDAPRKKKSGTGGPKTEAQIRKEKEQEILAGYEDEIKRKEKAFDFIEETMKGSMDQRMQEKAERGVVFGGFCLIIGLALLIYVIARYGANIPEFLNYLFIAAGIWIVPVGSFVALIFCYGMYRLVTGINDLIHLRRLKKEKGRS